MRALCPGVDVLVPSTPGSPEADAVGEVLAVSAAHVTVEVEGLAVRVPMQLVRTLRGAPVRVGIAPRRWAAAPRA